MGRLVIEFETKDESPDGIKTKVQCFSENEKPFVCYRITRDLIRKWGYDDSTLTDEQMKELACRLAEFLEEDLNQDGVDAILQEEFELEELDED